MRLLFLLPAILLATGIEPVGAADDDESLFDRQVLPLLQKHCGRCHSGKGAKAELNLTTAEGILRGGNTGRVVVAGKPDESRLYEVLRDGEMPPDGKGGLSPSDRELLATWIAGGARTGAGVVEGVSQWQVLPILQLRCTVCHGTRRQEGQLDLRTRESILRGGKSGPAIVAGRPDDSLLLTRIHAGEMPPKRDLVRVSVKPIEPAEIEMLTEWIRAGAPADPQQPDVATTEPDPLVSDADRQFWSFQPPQRPAIPEVKQADRVRTPIDAFVLRRLEVRGLSFSPRADRQTLIRRLFLDMLGLPPQPYDVEAFVADGSPDAWERLVDRVLASPHYGERWAGHWLDLAGYADSEGIQHADPIRPHAWRYRDYVVRAFNTNKPYDRFLLEQLAGDELATWQGAETLDAERYDNLVATGFLRMTEDATFAGITSFVPDRLEIIDDALEVFSASVLGLTIRCARCHSHKFDPIPQRDYYRLAAVFKGALDENDWLKPTRQEGDPGSNDRFLACVTRAEREAWQRQQQVIDGQAAAIRDRLAKLQQERTVEHVAARLAELPEPLRAEVRELLAVPADKRTDRQKSLAEQYEKQVRVDADALAKLDEEFRKAKEEADGQIQKLEAGRTPQPMIRALWDRGEPSPTYILRRGNYLTPGRLIGPGVPSVLTDGRTPFEATKPRADAPGSGLRLALAHWLTRPDHPLTARVFVNRVWRHHFQRGIVPTLDNFGRAGALPSHPELLDWLAVEFVAQNWSIKALHRLILTSAVYQQQSEVSDDAAAKDPENVWLSRMPLRRMDAETLHDSLLLVSGRLNTTPFGPADPVSARGDGLVTSEAVNGQWRRSIYVLHRRTQPLTILENFDRPRMSPNCVERSASTVAPQALHLMNNAQVRELAESFADRVLQETGSDRDRQIARLYLIAAGRAPTADERQLAVEFHTEFTRRWTNAGHQADAGRQTLVNLCHAMMNSAAFLYID